MTKGRVKQRRLSDTYVGHRTSQNSNRWSMASRESLCRSRSPSTIAEHSIPDSLSNKEEISRDSLCVPGKEDEN